VYVVRGGPGAGKGTQAALIADRLGIAHVASGDLFRTHLREGTALGGQARRYIERGALVPDDLTISMIEQRLDEADAAEGVILDGFPRTRRQAEALDSVLARKGSRVNGVFYLDVDRAELVRRLTGRWLCRLSDDHVYHAQSHPPTTPGRCDVDGAELYQRADDLPEVVAARLEKQLPPMFEVLDYYADKDVLHTVDGNRPPADVTDALLRTIVQPAT
jgi:adenylate kinase